MNKQTFLQLISLITVQTCALKHSLEILTKYDFPSEGPKKLSEIFIKYCYIFLRTLCKLGSDVENNIFEVDFALSDLHIIVRIIQFIAKYSRFIENAQTKYVPIEIVAPIEQLVKNISPGAQVIIRPQSSYTYDYREIIGHLKKAFEILETIIPHQEIQQIYIGYPKEIPILNFPTIAKGNIFSLAALGHEIGHFVYEKNKENNFKNIPLPENYDKKIDAIIAEENKIDEKTWLDNVQDYRYQFRDDIQSKHSKITLISYAWFKELIADIIGVRIFGPASFFSFALSGLAVHPLDYNPNLFKKTLRNILPLGNA